MPTVLINNVRRRRDRWIVTPITISVIVHLVALLLFFGREVLDIGRFTRRIQDVFSLVDVGPETRRTTQALAEPAGAEPFQRPTLHDFWRRGREYFLKDVELPKAPAATGETTPVPQTWQQRAVQVTAPKPEELGIGPKPAPGEMAGEVLRWQEEIRRSGPHSVGAEPGGPRGAVTMVSLDGWRPKDGPEQPERAVKPIAPRPDRLASPPIRPSFDRLTVEVPAPREALPLSRDPAAPVGPPVAQRPRPIALDVRFEVYQEPGERARFFRLSLRPKAGVKLPPMPKDVLAVVDVSLSVSDLELVEARATIRGLLRDLPKGDRFNLLVFSEYFTRLFPDFREVTPWRIDAAVRRINRLGRQKGTDVYGALNQIVEMIPPSIRPCQVFLLSDGWSTASVRDATRIVNAFDFRRMRRNVSIYTFDAGKWSNHYLLDLVAYRARGRFLFSPEVPGCAQRYLELARRYARPILTDLNIHFSNVKVGETYPVLVPNLYQGTPLVLYGKQVPGREASGRRRQISLRLVGRGAEGPRAFFYTGDLPKADPGRRAIAQEWARRKIHWLMSRIARYGFDRAWRDEMVRLGERYQLPTPY